MNGDIFVVGPFGESTTMSITPATFGAGESHSTVLTPTSTLADIFIGRFAVADGSLIWVKGAGGPNHDEAFGVRASGSGALVVGTFGGPDDNGFAIFGQGEVNQTTLVSHGGYDIFTAGYATDGSIVSARDAGGTSLYDQATCAAVGPDGTSVVGGRFGATAAFSNTTLGPANGVTDAFFAVYSP